MCAPNLISTSPYLPLCKRMMASISWLFLSMKWCTSTTTHLVQRKLNMFLILDENLTRPIHKNGQEIFSNLAKSGSFSFLFVDSYFRKSLRREFSKIACYASRHHDFHIRLTRLPIKFSPGSFNPFPLRFLWTKEASQQQDGKLRQARAQAREIPKSYVVNRT